MGPAPGGKTNTTFETTFEDKHVDKVDILFDIDNSREMVAWSDYMKEAIPDLVNRFVNPNCVSSWSFHRLRADRAPSPTATPPSA
jgi:hypothetical protein